MFKENATNNIKKDLTYLLDELKNQRKESEIVDKDFKVYRNTVDTLVKTYDSLNKLHSYQFYKKDVEYHSYFLSSLILETEKLQELKEKYKNSNSQFRCLTDAYLKLVEKIEQLDYESKSISINQFYKIIIPKESISTEKLIKIRKYIEHELPQDIEVVIE